MNFLSEHRLFVFLLQMLVIIGLARMTGEFCRRWKQPTITAEILIGIVLGPTILARIHPDFFTWLFPPDPIQQHMLETVSWLGILFFLLSTGLEVDFSSAWRQKGDAALIASSDLIIPMAVAMVPCMFLPTHYMGETAKPIMFSLFIASVMTISALPVTARVMQDLRLYKTDVGYLIISALTLNDVMGWVLFTAILSVIANTASNLGSISWMLTLTVLFVVVCLTIGRRSSDVMMKAIRRYNLPEIGTSLTLVSLLGIFCGIITLKIGVHALLGFFVAGIMAGQSRHLPERTRSIISEMVHALFIPLFFVSIGLKIDFAANFDLFLVVFIFLIGVIGRYLGAWVGVSFSKQSKANRNIISIAHTPGGEMQIVVGMLALELGLITQTVFVAIVVGAVVSSVILGPWMSWALSRRKGVHVMDYLVRQAIELDLSATTRGSAIHDLCNRIAESENLPDKNGIIQAVLAREKLVSTGLEAGIAVPHGRIHGLQGPFLAVGRSKAGIEWNTPDGNPAKLIFLLLSPEDADEQLDILRQLSTQLGTAKAHEGLLLASDADQVMELMRAAFGDDSNAQEAHSG